MTRRGQYRPGHDWHGTLAIIATLVGLAAVILAAGGWLLLKTRGL